jgi:hypothetical protein
MQSTGHTSTQASSFTPTHGWQITYVKLDAPSLSVVPVGVDFREMSPLFGQVVFSEDRLHGTGRFTRAAIDAFIRVDIEQFRSLKLRFILSWMNAIDRTDVYTCRVLCPYAGFRDNVSHLSLSLLFESSSQENDATCQLYKFGRFDFQSQAVTSFRTAYPGDGNSMRASSSERQRRGGQRPVKERARRCSL